MKLDRQRTPKSVLPRPGFAAERMKKGFKTQQQLADLTGLSTDIIQKIEATPPKPVSPASLEIYGNALRLPWEEVVETGRPQPVPSPTDANEIDHWIMANSGPWTPDPTGFQWKLYELHNKDVPGKKARGKVYDLHPHLIRQTFDEIKHWLTRHVEVADRVKGLSHRIGRNLHCFRNSSRPQDWWVIDDWIDGPSMAEVLAAGPLERARALHVMLQVAEVLHLLHAEGLIYRALAPRSIFLTPTGAVVTNFELTKILEGGLTVMPQEQWPNWDVFVAPEVRGREKARPSVDLYSWAMILAYALTGKKPTGPDPAIRCIADSGLPSDVTTFATECLLSKKRPDSFERLLASRKSSDDQQGGSRGR